ncbi:hypothetical protein [Halorubrum vacuolatum]|uniref:Uncharacterized protein n=1 Tax=Halorubrum vacuolatum TaxID=63740 RepID=A0A238WPU5_HALVU|nr:hypothetical protein [Halorubrum vacuolatum]SNR48497.1 hypothetical protein SAMN06264855_10947 [Halorubrum vacuolatum]
MVIAESPGIVLLGVISTLAVFAVIRWDATRIELSRPVLWATVAAVPISIGFAMYLLAPVPMTGIIVTANTGLVLYGFEREINSEPEEESVEPGTLPNRK